MTKTASQIGDEVLQKLARARWKEELAPMYDNGQRQVSSDGKSVSRTSTVAGTPEQMSAYQKVDAYRKGRESADPLRGGTTTLENHIGSQQLKNPGMSRGEAWSGPKPGQMPGRSRAARTLSQVGGAWGRMPGWGKGLAIGGAGLAAGAGLSHLLSNNSKE